LFENKKADNLHRIEKDANGILKTKGLTFEVKTTEFWVEFEKNPSLIPRKYS